MGWFVIAKLRQDHFDGLLMFTTSQLWKSKSISFTHTRRRLNMNGKFSMELQKHGVQRHWIGCPFMGENLREMEADDIRLTIF